MSPASSSIRPVARKLLAPSLLLLALAYALFWQIQRLIAAPQSISEISCGVALLLSFVLAVVCWRRLLVLSRNYAGVLQELEMQTARREREELNLAAEAMQHYAIFMLDPRGYVASWERDAERLLGYTGVDVMARHVSLFYSDDDARQGKPTHDLTIATTEGRSDDERWMFRKDGFRFRASVAIVAIRDPSGDLCGFTHVIREDLANSTA